MKHLVFFIHVISLMLGCVTIAMSLFAYIKYKSRLVKYYTYFLISMFSVILERAVTFYRLASVLNNEYLDVVFWIISCIGSGLLMYSLPLFIHDILQIKLTERKKLLFSMLAYLPIISLVLFYTLPYKITVLTIISSIIFIHLLYCLCLTAVQMKGVKELEIRGAIKTFLIIFGTWIPFLIFDSKIEQIEVLHKFLPYGILSEPVFYLVWNSCSLYYGFKYFGSFIDSLSLEQKASVRDKLDESNNMNDFLEKYKITNREKEAILLLAKGYTYNRISEELFISLTTARTHIYNIYQKTGVKNKVELINLIKNNIKA